MNSCIRAIYSTTGKFPGDKSSGNDKLHYTANSTYLPSSSSLQPSDHAPHFHWISPVPILRANSACVSMHLHMLLPGQQADTQRPETLKKPPNAGALMRP